jgi:hypothetical protein
MSIMGLLTDALRQPLLPLDEPYRAKLRLVLEASGLLDGSAAAAAGSGASAATLARATAAAHA